jgi:hypothetical protein
MATYHLRLKNDNKPNGKKVSAKAHINYILREGENAQKDCVFTAHQLPSWANGSPQKFFEAATRYEDKGNCRYKELELSLPNELTLEQNREIVETFIAHHLKNHYYAYGIHEKVGAISGFAHPHVHIMFSERLIDEVERRKERPAYKYFKRAAKPLKGEDVASFERRREHGAPKDKKWRDKNFLTSIRSDFAQIQNAVLEKNGYSIRVDSRSLDAQQQVAEQNGDSFLANFNLRVPETYIGIKRVHSNSSFVTDLKKTRQRNFQRLVSLLQLDINQSANTEFEVKAQVRRAELDAKNFSSTFADDIAKLNALKRKFTTTQQSIEKAQVEYLSPSDFNSLRAFKESLRQIYNLEKSLKEIKRPPDSQLNNLAAYEEIGAAIENRIITIKKSLKFNEVEKLEEKLKSESTYKNIALVAHQLFQHNLAILEEMKKISADILNKCKTLEEKNKPVIQEVFSLSDIKDNLRLLYHSLKKQQETTENKLAELRLKVISPSRALLIAKNVFLNGNFKKLNLEKRKYEKVAKKLDSDLESFQKVKSNFENTEWENPTEKFQHHYYLLKTKIELEHRQKEIKKWKTSLDKESQRLDYLTSTDGAKEKIALIAASILRKNLPTAQTFEKEKKKLAVIKHNLLLCKERLNFISDHKSKKNYFYRVIPSANLPQKDQNFIVSLIADALRGENYAVPLVARSSGNLEMEMEKEWELMSDLDKDEFLHKQIFCDL